LTAALAGKQFFSIQLASFANEHRAHKEINNLRGLRFPLPWLRVERVQSFFTVRAGRFNTRQQVRGFMKQHGGRIRGRIMAVYIRPERIVELYEVLNSGVDNNGRISRKPAAVSLGRRQVSSLNPAAKKIRVITSRRYKVKAIAQISKPADYKTRHKAASAAKSGGKEFFTLQTASFKEKKTALRAYARLRRHKRLTSLPDLRVEMVGSYFTLRVGRFTSRSRAVELADALRRFYPGLLVMRAYVLEKRIVRISGNAEGRDVSTVVETVSKTNKTDKVEAVNVEQGGAVKTALPSAAPVAKTAKTAKTISAAVKPIHRASPAAEPGAEEAGAGAGEENFIFKAAGSTEIKAPAKQKAVASGLKAVKKEEKSPLARSVFAETNLEDKDLSYAVVTIIAKDDRGEKIRMPSALFYDRHRDELYAINGVNNRVIVYGADYFPQNSLGKGRGIDSPMGGFIGKDGKIYITQAGAVGSLPRITVLNGAFMPERVIAVSKMPDSAGFIPQKIIINTNGRFYVTGLHSKKVLVLDRDGNFLRWFHVAIDKKGKYFFSGLDTPPDTAYIRDVISDSLGNLFFLSEETSKIYAFNVKENFLFSFGVKGGAKGKLSRPRGLCIDEGRRCFYVVDYMRHEVLIYDFTGKFRHEFGGRGWGAEWFNYPVDIVLGARHQVVVADFFNQEIKVFNVKWRETFPPRPDSLWKIK
ncbi:MAG TPA: hypothetical protein ENK33_06425, partial [Desulfobacterales bacterium]|nr:hypothetical protein [Desulfobacterales bacterium]